MSKIIAHFFRILSFLLIGCESFRFNGGSTRTPIVRQFDRNNHSSHSFHGKRDVITPSALSVVSRGTSRNCICVPFYYCNDGQVFSDGSGLIDIRHGWPCRTLYEVCCRNPHLSTSPPSMRPQTVNPNNSTGVNSTTQPPTFGPVSECGALNPNGVHARIIGFKESVTQFGEYPWQAAILEQTLVAGDWVSRFVCGGSLIWASVVVTAAHCVQGRNPDRLIVRLGEWDTQSESEFLPHQDLLTSEIVVHLSYYSGAYLNDIALLFLQTSANLSSHINTICLPFPSPRPSYEPASCWATGWGRNGLSGENQAVLHEVELPIISKAICTNLLRNTSLGSKFTFHPSYLCAGGNVGKDSCVGDGGGPLVCPSVSNPWRYVLAGITSWGLGCGRDKVPGVYTDVSQFTAWIETQISQRIPSFDPRIVKPSKEKRSKDDSTRASKPQQYL